MKNVGSTVVSHFVPSARSASENSVHCRVRTTGAVRCVLTVKSRAGSRLPRAEQIRGGSSREENWGHLGGLRLAPGGLGGPWWRAGAWGRGSHLGSPTSALHFVWRSPGQSGAARDLGSDFYNQGWQLPAG